MGFLSFLELSKTNWRVVSQLFKMAAILKMAAELGDR
jgi:hypothetical protein